MLQDFPRHAYIPGHDLARARQFYETMIGLRTKEVREGAVV